MSRQGAAHHTQRIALLLCLYLFTILINTCLSLLQNQLKQDYQLLVYALLGGDSRSVDNLFKLSPGLFPTMEDYIWIKLSLVNTSSSAADVGIRANSSGAMYNLSGSFSPSSGGAGGSGEC